MPKLLTWLGENGKTQWADRKHIVFERDVCRDPDDHWNVIRLDDGTWVLEKLTLYQCQDEFGNALNEWDHHVEAHQITEAEAIHLLREAGFLPCNEEWPEELQGRIGTRSSAETATAVIQSSRKERIDWGAVDSAITEHLKQHPDQDTAKQVAQAVSISVGSLAKASAWQRYQAEKKAKRSQSVHTLSLHEGFDPIDRSHALSETADNRDTIWHLAIQTATQHTRGKLNGLSLDRRNELIDYLTTSLDKFDGSPENQQEILKEIVRSWLADQGFPDQGWAHHSLPRSHRSRE